MSDHEDAVERFLREHADGLDRRTTPVTAGEAMNRAVPSDLPRRRPGAQRTASSRARGLALVAAASALLAGVAGFAIGRASYDPPAQLEAGGAGDDLDAESDAATQKDAGVATTAVGSASADRGAFSPGPEGIPLFTPVFIRTTDQGIAIRSYLETYEGEVGAMECPPGEWCPPPECSPTTNLVTGLSSREAVTQAWNPGYPAAEPVIVLGRNDFGFQEGAPVSVWVLRTTADVARVQVTAADGQADAMEPVDGWAVVALSGEHPALEIVGLAADGSTVATADGGQQWNQPQTCTQPPPSLPEPTGEPPADVAAAEAGVREAYEIAFTTGSDPEVTKTYLEDPDSYAEAREQVKEQFPEASATIQVEVREVRFLDASTAALYFELTYEGGAMFGQQVGLSKLIDGRRVVAKDTMCMVLGWGGGGCEGWEPQLHPAYIEGE